MKSLNFLRTLACSFAAMFAVACVDTDSLWDEIHGIKDELSSIEARIDSLEQVTAKNVAALQSIVSVGNIASWTYNAETGKGVITLVDGTKISISQEIKGYSIITVEKDENGNYYWALCVDGENIPLLIDNKKVPVNVTPALKISNNNEWMISVDGGVTWINTGISYYAKETSDTDGSVDSELVAFESAKLDGDYLIITLAGGTEIKVAIVGEAVFKTAEDALWFSRENLEKALAIEMNNVKAYTITEKPEGWKVRIEESYIFVTSPVNLDYYPSEGTIKALVLFENGAMPDIFSLDVAIEPMFTLSRANGTVSVALSEHTGEDFTGYVLKGWEKASYSAAAALAWFNQNYSSLDVRTGSKVYNLEEVIEDFDADKEYIVAAVPYLPASQVAQGTMKYQSSDLQSVETISMSGDWTVFNLKFDSADLYAVMPVPQYYGGFSTKELWEARGKTDYIEILNGGSGILMDILTYEGPANGFPDYEVSESLVPATEYVVWYVPVTATEDGLYTEDSFVEYTFTTPDVVAESSIPAPAFNVTEITSAGFSAEVTPAANTYKTYSAIVKSTVIAEMTDADIVRYLIGVNQFSEGAAVNNITKGSFDPSDEVYLLAVSLTGEGKFGAIVKEKVALKELVFTDALGVEVAGVECDDEGNATLSLSFKGSPVSMTYMASTYNLYGESLQGLLAKKQLEDIAFTVEISELTDGKLTLSGLKVGEEYTFYAVVRDAKNNHSYIYDDYTFVPVLNAEYVLASDKDYEYGMPKLSGTLSGSANPKTYVLNVEMPDECKKYWLFFGDSDYIPSDAYQAIDRLVTMFLAEVGVGETVHTESTSITYSSVVYPYSRIYMAWKDDKGRYHGVYEYNPNKK